MCLQHTIHIAQRNYGQPKFDYLQRILQILQREKSLSLTGKLPKLESFSSALAPLEPTKVVCHLEVVSCSSKVFGVKYERVSNMVMQYGMATMAFYVVSI